MTANWKNLIRCIWKSRKSCICKMSKLKSSKTHCSISVRSLDSRSFLNREVVPLDWLPDCGTWMDRNCTSEIGKNLHTFYLAPMNQWYVDALIFSFPTPFMHIISPLSIYKVSFTFCIGLGILRSGNSRIGSVKCEWE